VVFGSLLISLLNHADRVTSASLAQLVNVIAPIMTEPGGPAWRQATFYPFATTARLARGTALQVNLDVPTYTTAVYGTVPLADVAATYDETDGTAALFLVNRSQHEPLEVQVDLGAAGVSQILEAHSLHDGDLTAANTVQDQERVRLQVNHSARMDGNRCVITLPPVSWSAVALG